VPSTDGSKKDSKQRAEGAGAGTGEEHAMVAANSKDGVAKKVAKNTSGAAAAGKADPKPNPNPKVPAATRVGLKAESPSLKKSPVEESAKDSSKESAKDSAKESAKRSESPQRSAKAARPHDAQMFGLLSKYPLLPAILLVVFVVCGTAITIVLTQPDDPAVKEKKQQQQAKEDQRAAAAKAKKREAAVLAIGKGDCVRLTQAEPVKVACGAEAAAKYRVVRTAAALTDCGSAVGITAIDASPKRKLCLQAA
jgi:hypothetical protein